MGCSKNLVDSENLMGLFEKNGFKCTHDAENPQGEIVVVNTCGFIADAKEESINTILEFCELKNRKKIESLYVMGCLSERYLADLEQEIPEVDGWYGKFNYRELVNDLVVGAFLAFLFGQVNQIFKGCAFPVPFCFFALVRDSLIIFRAAIKESYHPIMHLHILVLVIVFDGLCISAQLAVVYAGVCLVFDDDNMMLHAASAIGLHLGYQVNALPLLPHLDTL
jgi:hypothetical protein